MTIIKSIYKKCLKFKKILSEKEKMNLHNKIFKVFKENRDVIQDKFSTDYVKARMQKKQISYKLICRVMKNIPGVEFQ